MRSVLAVPGRMVRGFVEYGGVWVLVQIVVIVLAVLIPKWTGKSNFIFELETVTDVIGMVFAVPGALLSLASMGFLGRSLSPFPPPPSYSRLRVNGFYAWMRHPLYTGLIVGSFGLSIWRQSWVGVAFTVVVFLFFDRKAVVEERLLSERFPEYADYAQRVHRFFPGIY